MNFEKLQVWKRSKDLSVSIYRELANLKDWGFKDQITRSGLSIPSNVSEGMVRASSREKIRFINIAEGSCAELRTQVYIGADIGYISKVTADKWIGETLQIGAMLNGLTRSIEKKL